MLSSNTELYPELSEMTWESKENAFAQMPMKYNVNTAGWAAGSHRGRCQIEP